MRGFIYLFSVGVIVMSPCQTMLASKLLSLNPKVDKETNK